MLGDMAENKYWFCCLNPERPQLSARIHLLPPPSTPLSGPYGNYKIPLCYLDRKLHSRMLVSRNAIGLPRIFPHNIHPRGTHWHRTQPTLNLNFPVIYPAGTHSSDARAIFIFRPCAFAFSYTQPPFQYRYRLLAFLQQDMRKSNVIFAKGGRPALCIAYIVYIAMIKMLCSLIMCSCLWVFCSYFGWGSPSTCAKRSNVPENCLRPISYWIWYGVENS